MVVKKAPFLKKCLPRSLEAEKETFVKIIVSNSTKYDTAIIIVFLAELFEVKRGRRSRNKLFCGFLVRIACITSAPKKKIWNLEFF